MNAIQPLTLRPSRTLAFLTAVLAAIACLAGAASTRAEDRPPTDATANPLLGDGGPGDPTGGVESSLENGSVTYWITHLKAGNRDAGQQLWEGYFRRLVGLARQKLRGAKVRTADEEDVALSAFDSFHRGAERGRFPQVNDRNDLWRLLAVITACKAIDLINLEGRQKRGGDAVLGESALLGEAGDLEAKGSLDQVLGREPTPESAAEVAEECERLLARLQDAQLRTKFCPGSTAHDRFQQYVREGVFFEMWKAGLLGTTAPRASTGTG